jgi:RimJ/RimL family protein N-acetyltransferase
VTTPTLEGPRLRLEPLTLAHLPALEQIALGPASAPIWRYMLTTVKTPADLRTWAETALKLEAAGTGMPWVTILKSQSPETPDKVIGSTRYFDLDLHHSTVEIGTPGSPPSTTAPASTPRPNSSS